LGAGPPKTAFRQGFISLCKRLQYAPFRGLTAAFLIGRSMVKIRLARAGAKKRPFYHLVATDSRRPRDSHYIERLGYYNPLATGGEQKLVVDTARIEHWTKNGAQVSERVAFLIKGAPAKAEGTAPKAA
jgi:small subunit ribosomal protein S16